PTAASVGEADIIILAHIGLAMMGEGEVIYQGNRMPAKQALTAAGITPLVPFAKDSLAIMSSDAYATAIAALASERLDGLLLSSMAVFALSLEGLNGNVSPFLAPVVGDATRAWVAENVRNWLKGSYLWSLWTDKERPRALQDP